MARPVPMVRRSQEIKKKFQIEMRGACASVFNQSNTQKRKDKMISKNRIKKLSAYDERIMQRTAQVIIARRLYDERVKRDKIDCRLIVEVCSEVLKMKNVDGCKIKKGVGYDDSRWGSAFTRKVYRTLKLNENILRERNRISR